MQIQMTSAIEKDLGNSPFVTEISGIYPCICDIEYDLEHVDKVVLLNLTMLVCKGCAI